MAAETNKSSESFEPSPTSAPPSDVEIPVESIYGDNLPIAPIEPPEPTATPEGIGSQTGSTKEDPNSKGQRKITNSKGNSIKIGFIPFLILIASLGTGLFILGNKFRVNMAGGTPVIEKSDFYTQLPETNESDKKDADDVAEVTTQSQKQKRNLNFLRDLGLYKRENSYTSNELASSRLKLAKKTIIWVTSEPNNPKMISLLSAIKNRSPLPIFIVTGSETPNTRIQDALDAGFSVSKVTSTLELPYSILIIDDRILMDISREHWIWETTDKQIIAETAKWANNLLKGAKILDNKSR